MQKKLAGYLSLSFFSFFFFTVVLHASAQVPETPLAQAFTPEISAPPTPTIYAQKPTPEPTKQAELAQSVFPSPTIYIAPPQKKETLGAKALSTDEVPEPTAMPTIAAQPTAAPTQPPTAPAPINAGDLESLFEKYSGEFGVNKEDLKGIAQCESGFNSTSDTGLYAGMFQFSTETWTSTRTAMGLDANPDLRKNPEEAIRTAAFKIHHGGRGAWPNC